MLQVAQLQKSYGTRILFSDVSFSVSPKEVVGLVGRNGSGKSTLFKILMGQEESDQGEIHFSKAYKIGYLDQHIHFTEKTVIDECATALPKGQELDLYKAEALLFGLGFTLEDMQKDPKKFSGGFQLRMNLVKSLLQEPDLLLLDEPTNYLDILSLHWLRNFLKEFPGEVILITHDRHFMDSAVTHVMGIHRGSLRKIEGTTNKYYEQLAIDEEIHEKTRVNQEKKIKEMQNFVDRFGAKATKAKQAQSKLKQIQKITPLTKLSSEAELGFRFNYKNTPAKVLMTINDLSFSFDGNNNLFEELNFRVVPEDRIAIIGKNGYGKTTLLNVISGQLKGEGSISSHPDVTLSYYQQTNKKKLSPRANIIEEISSENIHLSTSQVRAICGAMMFSGDDAEKKISVLSGGEQGRVLLGKVIAKSCNVLLLDEPTNHLDMESIQVMTQEIANFPGAVLFVTHDEDLLSQLATKIIVFKDGAARLFLGTYEEFLEKEGWGEIQVKKEKKSSGDRKENKRKRALLIQERAKKLNPIKTEILKLEKKIIIDEESLEMENEKVSTTALDSPESKELFKKIGEVQIQLASSYQKLDEFIEQQDKIILFYEQKLSELLDT
jgi:ATP-binding cassette, subfamily F, member 3